MEWFGSDWVRGGDIVYNMNLSFGQEPHCLECYSVVNGKLAVQLPPQLVRDTQGRGKSIDCVLGCIAVTLRT